MDILEIIKGFEAIKGKVYLDTATTGPLHKRVYEAAKSYLDQRYLYGADLQDYKNWVNKAHTARESVAKLLNGAPEEIAFTKNASEGINHAANIIPFEPGDNVIVPDLSFPSNAYAFMNLAKQGVQVKLAKSNNGQISFDSLVSCVNKKTKAISVCHVEFSSGYKYDIGKIGKFARERDIFFHVDATQAAGSMLIDVKEHNIDFLSFSTYKWLCCPLGLGVFYCDKRILKNANPWHVGWFGVKNRFDFSELKLDLANTAEMFEAGGLNYSGIFALDEAIKIYMEAGPVNVQGRVLQLTDYLVNKLNEIGIEIVGPFAVNNRSGITYAIFPDPERVSKSLRNNNIQINMGNGKARISPHFFNTEEDIDSLISAIKNA